MHPQDIRDRRLRRFALAILIGAICVSALIRWAESQAQTVLTCPPVTSALQVSVCWTNPTENVPETGQTVGTPIPAACAPGVALCGKLTQTRIEYGSCTGTPAVFGTKAGEIIVPQPATSAYVSNVVPQVYCLRAIVKNDTGVEAAPSNVSVKTVTAPVPRPALLSTQTIAYEIRENASGELVATRIGVVPIGALCASERQQVVAGVTYSLIDQRLVDVVNWPQSSQITEVWARCG